MLTVYDVMCYVVYFCVRCKANISCVFRKLCSRGAKHWAGCEAWRQYESSIWYQVRFVGEVEEEKFGVVIFGYLV